MAQKLDITLADGRTLTVTPTLLDKVGFEAYLRANPRYGSMGDNVIRMQAFWAWAAAKREHGLALSWDEFLDGGQALDVAPHDEDDELATWQSDREEVEGVGEDMPADHLPS